MSKREEPPLHDVDGGFGGRFTTTPWDAEGIATLEASGGDVRSALEAGLRAVLTLAEAGSAASDRVAPLQGEGDDFAELFRNLADDLLDQMRDASFACHDVAIDGVLQREGGGYVAWGYATESAVPAPVSLLPIMRGAPEVESVADEVVFRVSMVRAEA
jgi:hypothetical protein